MAKKIVDLYVNRAYIEVTMSAANTITFSQIRWAVGTFEGIAIKVIRILYYPSLASRREIVAATDSLNMGITGRNDLASLDPTNQGIYDTRNIVGVGANVEHMDNPIESKFDSLPGGGLLLPANPMYLAADSAGFVAAAVVRAIVYYVFVRLSDKESLEVLQTIIPGNV